MKRSLLLAGVLILTGAMLGFEARPTASPVWSVAALPYRVLVEVEPVDLGGRLADSLPASVDLDFTPAGLAALGVQGPVDLESIQVFRFDPAGGEVLPGPVWPFSRAEGERASRFVDRSLPWDFPFYRPFPGGAYLANVKGKGERGSLVWDHDQQRNQSSFYAVYFGTQPEGQPARTPRQGFVGDGSPRRDRETSSLTGSLYNRVAIDDWDGDGLTDLIIGTGFGHIMLFHNEGDRQHPKFTAGEYLADADGNVIVGGGMASPDVADWNGDGLRDLIVGEERTAGVVWYENVGSNSARKLILRGQIEADGKPLVLPAKPNPEAPHYKKDYAPAVDAVDWDGDGDLDLLLGGYITGHIWFYENTGSAADGEPTLSFRGPLEADGEPIDTIWGAHPCAADLDADGDLDLLTGSFGQAVGGGDATHEFLLYYENVGTRFKPSLTSREVDYRGGPPKGILAQARATDWNADGLPDLVISTTDAVHLATNVGSEHAPTWDVALQRASWGLAPLSASQLMDWDGDGHVDLITSPLDGAGVPRVRLNLGQGAHGVFGPPQPLLPEGQTIDHPQPYGDPWAFVSLYDFEGDGDYDILWADGPGNVYLHRNEGSQATPRFDTVGEKLTTADGTPLKVGPPVVPREEIKDFTAMQGSRAGVAAADFNNDGLTDLALGDALGDVFYFENRGTNLRPVFAEGLKLARLGSRAKPLVYDWDHDGNRDLLVISWSGQMSWFRNAGPGAQPQFAPPQAMDLPPTVPYSPRLVIGDWNADGDDDLLIMSSYPWFCWLEGSYVEHGSPKARVLKFEAKPGLE